MKRKLRFTSLFLIVAMILTLSAGCGVKTPTPSVSPSATPKVTTKTGPYNIAVIIKATDSDFWQYLLIGANNYSKDNPNLVKVTTYGPKSESDIDQQVSILENVISTKPDAIVIASTSSDATVPALNKAASQGIKIITVDNKVKTDKVNSFLATNNLKGGALAADNLVAALKAKNIALKGSIGVISAMAGIQVLTDRDTGFINRLKEIAPNVKILQTRYTDNDITKALSAAEDEMTANSDLIGFFADNNHTGDGIARAIKERKMNNKIMGTAFDSDPEEVSSLKDGSLKALILQDPYGMGYKGVDFAVKALKGQTIPAVVDTGATAVTLTNMNNTDIKGLLDPTTKKK